MSEILSREDAARAFLNGKDLEMRYKDSNDTEGGWTRPEDPDVFWWHIYRQSSDFRVKPMSKAAFKEGEFAYLVSYDDAKDGCRYASSFRFHEGAMFVKVLENQNYNDDGDPGWTYEVEDSKGTSQIVHERDLRKASEVAPILIDE